MGQQGTSLFDRRTARGDDQIRNNEKLTRFEKAAQRGPKGASGRMRSHRRGGDRPMINPVRQAKMGGLKILFTVGPPAKLFLGGGG